MFLAIKSNNKYIVLLCYFSVVGGDVNLPCLLITIASICVLNVLLVLASRRYMSHHVAIFKQSGGWGNMSHCHMGQDELWL